MSNSVRPHRQQPTRLPRPWDSPGKNTGVGCHFLLQCMKVKSESEVAQLCPTLSDPMDCSLIGSSVHGIFQARVLEWGAIAFSIIRLSRGLFCVLFWVLNPKSYLYLLGRSRNQSKQQYCWAVLQGLKNTFTVFGKVLLLLLRRFSRVRLCATP